MLITFSGRKSGKMFTIPVNYVQDGDKITIFSDRERVWWRNLQGGAKLLVRVKGKKVEATGEAIEDQNAVARGLRDYLQKTPNYAKYFNVTFDSDGHLNLEEVAKAAKDRIMVQAKFGRH
jgi:deazaflavin-dependent oxidoreductase (nitroreductase family)